MIRRSTWISLLVFALLLGLAWYLNRPKPVEPVPTPTSESESPVALFADESGEVTAFQISGDSKTISLAQEGNRGWVFTDDADKDLPVDQSQAESAATQFKALALLEQKVIIAPQYVGLNPPLYTITLQFAHETEHTLLVGEQTPSGSGYYVQLDGGDVAIADYYGMQAILNLLVASPYAPTPTPSPAP